MDLFWLFVGLLFVLAGVVGSILPLIPGPPLAYVGLLMQQFTSHPPFSIKFLLLWAAITVAVFFLDMLVPVYGTQRFGGTRYGMWGTTIGIVIGLFFAPWGIIVGPFLGALVGELMARNPSGKALRAAFGSFLGFLLGTLLKLTACLCMGWYIIHTLAA